MAGVLEGVTVLDLAQNWAGPGISMYLADQGANVIKIEPPGGDAARGWGVSPLLTNTSKSFLAVNRNKRSIAVDLGQPEGRQIVHDLVKTADVLVLNARPSVVGRLGIDYDTLSAINPRLVYAHVLGYGERGPYASFPAYDSIAQAMSGAMHRTLPDGTPIATGVYLADCSVPMLLAYGVTLALLEREKTGRGQKVETSLLAASVAMQSVDLVQLEGEEPAARNQPLGASSIRCADGKYINVSALTEKQFLALVQLLEIEWIFESPEYLEAGRMTLGLLGNYREQVAEAYLQRTAAEWLQLLQDADIPCGPILTRDEVFDDPQMLANEIIIPVEYPEVGQTKILGTPVRLSANPGGVRHRAPMLGEHTDDIAREAGYSDEQIAALRAKGVLV